jgi:cation transport ATPase
MLNKWLENEPKETLICAVISAVSLVLSITGALKGILPFDIAWIAIILCGIPILVGAFKGVVFERDIIASLVINLSAVVLSALGVLNPVTGALWHNFGSVFVVVNAALLLRLKDTDSGN